MFLFPSATDTFGQVILEAQASGLPVLAVAEGGPLSLIEDRVSGLLREADAPRWPTRCSSSRPRRCCASASRAPRSPRCASAPGSGRSARLGEGYQRVLFDSVNSEGLNELTVLPAA